MAPEATATWPKWDPERPSGTPEDETLNAKIDTLLNTAGRPTHVLASNERFKTIDQVKELDEASLVLLPEKFEVFPSSDDFDYWRRYLGVEI